MIVRSATLEVRSRKRIELINITKQIAEKVAESKIGNGIAVLHSRHTTSALIINEDEERLKSDILNLIDRLVPTGSGYRHDEIDNNADAHLRQTLLQPSLTIPIYNGRLALGTWQNVFFLELDGPRNREVVLILLGE